MGGGVIPPWAGHSTRSVEKGKVSSKRVEKKKIVTVRGHGDNWGHAWGKLCNVFTLLGGRTHAGEYPKVGKKGNAFVPLWGRVNWWRGGNFQRSPTI